MRNSAATITLAALAATSATGAESDLQSQMSETAVVESVNVSTNLGGDSFAALSSRSTEQVLDRLVNITFVNADLENALRIISRQMDLNIIIGPGVRGRTITLDLQDVPLRFALDAILRANGLGFVVERGGIVRVVDQAVISPDPVERQLLVRRMNWQVATELEPILTDFVTDEGDIRTDPATNSVIISDVPSRIEDIDALLTELDAPERQVLIEARLVDMTEGALRQLRSNFSLSRMDSQASDGGDFRGDNLGNAPFNQNAPGPRGLTTVPDNASYLPLDALGFATPALANPAAVWTFGDEVLGYDLGLLFEALESEELARVLASPRVATINNVPADIEIIREEPYVESTFNPGGQTTQSILFKDVGLTLTVLPRITNNGWVRMNIQTEQQILVDRESIVGSTVPIIARRSSNSNVIVRDRETVALGGLRQMEAINSEDGTPWFKDLPFFGFLFRGNDYSRSRIDFYAFVTPTILEDPTLNGAERYAFDLLDLEWDLPEDYFFDNVEIESTY